MQGELLKALSSSYDFKVETFVPVYQGEHKTRIIVCSTTNEAFIDSQIKMLVYFCLALHLNQGIKYLVGKEWHVNCACGMCGRSGYVTTVHVRNFQNAQFPPNLIPRSYCVAIIVTPWP